MQQVIFRLPIYWWSPDGIPIYGFGLMLFFAFLACTWLGGRRAEKVGMKKEVVQDLAIWVFIGGLLGARIFFIYGEEEAPASVGEFFYRLPRIWEGGIIGCPISNQVEGNPLDDLKLHKMYVDWVVIVA